MVDFRRLFDRYRVQWRDRGKNVSHGNIVISCPWCNKTSNPDRGEHLAISSAGEYFCYRNPAHKGKSLPRLFALLRIPEHEYAHLPKFKELPKEEKQEKDFSLLRYFKPAEDSVEALDYLQSRLFPDPVRTCRTFKLLVDTEGKWAGRLIIPLTVGWTGRSMRSHIEPRYLSETTEDGFFAHSQRSSSCIIVEGALDAMKIVTVSTQFDVIGKCGSRISAALLNYIREHRYLTIWNIPDREVDGVQKIQEAGLLKSYCTWSDVKLYELKHHKDFGAMEDYQTRRTLGELR